MPLGALGRVAIHGLKSGTSFMNEVLRLSKTSNIDYALISAIGTLSQAELGFYDGASKKYITKKLSEHLELVSCSGSLSRDSEGSPVIHVHASVSDKDTKTYSGHLIGATVGYLVELYLVEVAGTELIKVKDESTGLLALQD
jgi:predicted DNA-binding protein with PD1-like motif